MLETRDLSYVITAHSTSPRKPSKAFRKGDGRTPYHIHPIWCASTLLAESVLPEVLRWDGAQALLYHDVLEDTTTPLAPWLSREVVRLVEDMTFASSSEERKLVWGKSSEVRLLKLYDKTSNILDGGWMDTEKRATYLEYTRQLIADVRSNFGELNITRMAEAICV